MVARLAPLWRRFEGRALARARRPRVAGRVLVTSSRARVAIAVGWKLEAQLPAPGSSTRSRPDIPARLDRLPWSRFHWRVVFGLGIVWILDGLEVTIIGFLAPTLTSKGSGISLTEGDIALAQSIYVAGACIGALFFGQLTDRFGRKKLFLITLGHVPARDGGDRVLDDRALVLGRALFHRRRDRRRVLGDQLRDRRDDPGAGPRPRRPDHQRLVLARRGRRRPALARLAEGVAVCARRRLAAVVRDGRAARRRDPASSAATCPRARAGCSSTGARRRPSGSSTTIEAEVREETGQELEEPDDSIKVRQRRSIPFREIARTASRSIPSARCSASRCSSARPSSTTP